MTGEDTSSLGEVSPISDVSSSSPWASSLFCMSFHPTSPEPLNQLHHSAGYPIISHFTTRPMSNMAGFNIGGTNASGLVRTRVPLHVPAVNPLPGSRDSRKLWVDRQGNPHRSPYEAILG